MSDEQRHGGIGRGVIGLGVVAAAAVIGLVLAGIALSDRSDRIAELESEIDAAQLDASTIAAERDLNASAAAITESRWLAAVAVSGDHSPPQSRLLAVEALNRSSTPEAMAAIGELLFADVRVKPPIADLAHDGPVWVTAAATNADLVATGSDDGTAKLWSTAGELQATLAHDGRVRAIAFAGNDEIVATGTAEGTVTAWTTAGEQVASTRHSDQVNAIAVSDDAALMVSGASDGFAIVTDTASGGTVHELEHPDAVWTVAFSSDDTRIATGSQDGIARVWDLATGNEVASYDLGQQVSALGFSPDGRWLFAGSQGATGLLIDLETGDASEPLEASFRGGLLDTEWHPDNNELAVVSIGGVHRFDLATRELIAEHSVAGGVRNVAYGADGSWFAVVSGDFQFSFGEVTFWDTATGTQLAGLNLGGPVETVAIHPSGAVVAGFRSTQDLVEVGGGLIAPGLSNWTALACEGTDATISESTWRQLSGEAAEVIVDCPSMSG